jgi:hypothetical protein
VVVCSHWIDCLLIHRRSRSGNGVSLTTWMDSSFQETATFKTTGTSWNLPRGYNKIYLLVLKWTLVYWHLKCPQKRPAARHGHWFRPCYTQHSSLKGISSYTVYCDYLVLMKTSNRNVFLHLLTVIVNYFWLYKSRNHLLVCKSSKGRNKNQLRKPILYEQQILCMHVYIFLSNAGNIKWLYIIINLTPGLL